MATKPGLSYLRRTRQKNHGPATWFDVTNAYDAGRREALEWVLAWLADREPRSDGGAWDAVMLVESIGQEIGSASV